MERRERARGASKWREKVKRGASKWREKVKRGARERKGKVNKDEGNREKCRERKRKKWRGIREEN